MSLFGQTSGWRFIRLILIARFYIDVYGGQAIEIDADGTSETFVGGAISTGPTSTHTPIKVDVVPRGGISTDIDFSKLGGIGPELPPRLDATSICKSMLTSYPRFHNVFCPLPRDGILVTLSVVLFGALAPLILFHLCVRIWKIFTVDSASFSDRRAATVESTGPEEEPLDLDESRVKEKTSSVLKNYGACDDADAPLGERQRSATDASTITDDHSDFFKDTDFESAPNGNGGTIPTEV